MTSTTQRMIDYLRDQQLYTLLDGMAAATPPMMPGTSSPIAAIAQGAGRAGERETKVGPARSAA